MSDTMATVLSILLVLATLALVLGRGSLLRIDAGAKWRLALMWLAIFVVATLAVGAVL